MSLFDKLSEKLRDHARDELCTSLQALGIQAQLSERGRPEEDITSSKRFLGDGSKSLGIIDILEGPIRWLNVKKQVQDEDGWVIAGAEHWVECGIPDTKVQPGFSEVRLKLKRTKKFPLLGRVVRTRWDGKDFGTGVRNRLNQDITVINVQIKIGAYPQYCCWILTADKISIPSELWDYYQRIAKHLLA